MSAPLHVANLSSLMMHIQGQRGVSENQFIDTFGLSNGSTVTIITNTIDNSPYFFIQGFIQFLRETSLGVKSEFKIMTPTENHLQEYFPLELFDTVVSRSDYDILFTADMEGLRLGNFFRRPSVLRDKLEKLISCPYETFGILGPLMWDTIIENGGLNTLAQMFQETIELDIYYEMRLINPYCFDDPPHT